MTGAAQHHDIIDWNVVLYLQKFADNLVIFGYDSLNSRYNDFTRQVFFTDIFQSSCEEGGRNIKNDNIGLIDYIVNIGTDILRRQVELDRTQVIRISFGGLNTFNCFAVPH